MSTSIKFEEKCKSFFNPATDLIKNLIFFILFSISDYRQHLWWVLLASHQLWPMLNVRIMMQILSNAIWVSGCAEPPVSSAYSSLPFAQLDPHLPQEKSHCLVSKCFCKNFLSPAADVEPSRGMVLPVPGLNTEVCLLFTSSACPLVWWSHIFLCISISLSLDISTHWENKYFCFTSLFEVFPNLEVKVSEDA